MDTELYGTVMHWAASRYEIEKSKWHRAEILRWRG